MGSVTSEPCTSRRHPGGSPPPTVSGEHARCSAPLGGGRRLARLVSHLVRRRRVAEPSLCLGAQARGFDVGGSLVPARAPAPHSWSFPRFLWSQPAGGGCGEQGWGSACTHLCPASLDSGEIYGVRAGTLPQQSNGTAHDGFCAGLKAS